MKLKHHFMKSTVILSMVASTALYATNGDTLVGVGAKTRAMGGAGIAFSHGAESTLVNPALITHVQDTEISFGGTIFMPSIKTETPMSGGKKSKSDADISMIPAVAAVSHLDNGLHIGAGMWGTAGMGTDFRGHPDLFDMETTLQLMQFAVPVAYKFGGLSLGIAPILQYGSLDIHYNYGGTNVGDGQHQDFGLGASLGATYDFGTGFTVGAVYKTKIKMDYGNAIPTATAPFGLSFGSHLDQPAEFGIGLGWRSGPHGIAIDWKRILWSHATGYKEFNWDDQDVFAIGYQYDAGTWSARIGFNHGKTPIKASGNPAIDMFNLLGFPATQENHFTLGGTYAFSKNFSADVTAVYGFNKDSSADVSAMFGSGAQVKNKHSELGLTVQLNYKF
ncbi:porin [Nitratifractor sp.]|uniref:OmpP1/FadL family transporter n=1 Tax=Nitratifractor sp. TaxID=2268144 RepID=UPI0025FFDAE0|nr:porin [Nitratifractor sp.]